MSSNQIDVNELKQLAQSYREQLYLMCELIRKNHEVEEEYEKGSKYIERLTIKKQIKYLQMAVDARKETINHRIEARKMKKKLTDVMETAGRLGILIEDGWIPRLKHYHRRACIYFNKQMILLIVMFLINFYWFWK